MADSGLPWTTLRATQFHDLILMTALQMVWLPGKAARAIRAGANLAPDRPWADGPGRTSWMRGCARRATANPAGANGWRGTAVDARRNHGLHNGQAESTQATRRASPGAIAHGSVRIEWLDGTTAASPGWSVPAPDTSCGGGHPVAAAARWEDRQGLAPTRCAAQWRGAAPGRSVNPGAGTIRKGRAVVQLAPHKQPTRGRLERIAIEWVVQLVGCTTAGRPRRESGRATWRTRAGCCQC